MTDSRGCGRRRGIALLMALCTLAMVGAMIAAALYTVGELRRGAARLGTLERARLAAERAMVLALAEAPESLAAGETRAIAIDAAQLRHAADETTAARVTGLPGGVRRFTVLARAGHRHRVAEQGLHALAARAVPRVDVGAAIAAGDAITVGDAWSIGVDSLAGCAATMGEPLALVQLPSLAALDWPGAPAGAALEGAPTAAEVLAMLSSRATVELSAGAEASPAPVAAGAQCIAGANNWGSASGACSGHFPVVHARGDLRITGGEGQGVLLVSGALTVTGALRYSGLIVAGGPVVFEGAGSDVQGAIMTSESVHLRSGGRVTGSTCAVRAGLGGAARWELLPRWGWGGIR